MTRCALLSATKTHTLNFKIFFYQVIKIDTARDHIAPRKGWRRVLHLKSSAKLFENLERQKRDLPFVIIFEIKKTISANSAPGYALDLRHLNGWKLIGLAVVMIDKIMPLRNIKMADFHVSP